MENVIIGTKITILVRIEPIGGVHMSEYDFDCTFHTNSSKKLLIPKDLMVMEDDDSYTALVDTAYLSAGELELRVHAKLPDGRFEGNVRDEIEDVKLNIKLIR